MDEYQSELRCIDDSGEIWHAQPYNAKYQQLAQDQHVRIRSASLSAHTTDYHSTFGMRHYTNILSLPYPCELAARMKFDEVEACKSFETSQLMSAIKSSVPLLRHPIIVTRILDEKLAQKPVSELENCVNSHEEYRVRFNVAAFVGEGPTLKIQTKTGSKMQLADYDLKKAPALKKDQTLVTCVQMLAKDCTSMTSSKFAKILLLDQGKFFGDLPPRDTIKGAKKDIVDPLVK